MSSAKSSKSSFLARMDAPLAWSNRVFYFLITTYILISLAAFYFAPHDNMPNSTTFNLVRNVSGKLGLSIASFIWFEFGLTLIPPLVAFMVLVSLSPREKISKNYFYTVSMTFVTTVLFTFALSLPSLSVGSLAIKTYGELLAPLRSFLIEHIGRMGVALLMVSSFVLLFKDSALIKKGFSLFTSFISLKFSQISLITRKRIKGVSLNTLSCFARPFQYFFNRLKSISLRKKVAPTQHESIIRERLPDAGILSTSNTHYSPLLEISPLNDLDVEPASMQVGVEKKTAAIKQNQQNNFLPNGNENLPYFAPSTEMFRSQDASKDKNAGKKKRENDQTAENLIKILADFGVQGEIIGYTSAPMVNVYEFRPERGLKIAKVQSLTDDLALALKVDSIIVSPISEKQAVGIEVPKSEREYVFLGDVLKSDEFRSAESPLQIAFGRSLYGRTCSMDLRKMPHLLMAGATGSGKSVAINSLICNVLMRSGPDEVKMIFVDPKMLELSVYEGIPQLLMPVITDSDRASYALKWAVAEMESRYAMMGEAKVRNIEGFNEFWSRLPLIQKTTWLQSYPKMTGKKLPYILIVIDELCDLMMNSPKDVENSIQRLSQKARASGIHLVLATQRPSVDVITGVIKANLPCRAAFQVVSRHDSRTILDQVGAEKLLGNGDMFLQVPGQRKLERIQATFIGDEEVNLFVSDLKRAYPNPQYDDSVMSWVEKQALMNKSGSDSKNSDENSSEIDSLFEEASLLAEKSGAVSASFLQRHLKIGYNRAARIVESMEEMGLCGKQDGAKPREWFGRQYSQD